jgi:uncharacterized glyoxalase superfamily protein PhnB
LIWKSRGEHQAKKVKLNTVSSTGVEIYQRALAAGANITQALEESMIAYSFTATDQDGNHWWVNAETGFLDKLRV